MSGKKITRRKFITVTSLGAAGAWAGLHPGLARAMRGSGGGGMGGGGGGGGTTVIDPPVGPAFRDPVAMPMTRTGNLVEVTVEPMISAVNVNGTTANLLTYNGHYPGPTIRVRKGDVLRVNHLNSLPYTAETNLLGYQRNITNLHTHGWHVSPEPPQDDVMYGLNPGQAYRHEYDTSLQAGGTLNFYHPHRHGVSAEQYWAGLAGALVVEDETAALADIETHIMVLKDISLSGSEPAPHSMMSDYMQGKEGNIIMVNGQVNPLLSSQPGQVQRWRILNASNARFYRLSLTGHSMHLIGTDGGLLDKAYPYPEILLAPGERVDILVQASYTKGNYKFLSLPYSRRGNLTSEQITLMTLSVKGSRASGSLPASINPNAARVDPNSVMIAAERTLVLGMGQGNATINGQDFDVDPFTVMSGLGTFEVWTVVNDSGMDHPFHQHVNAAQVLAIRGIHPSYPPYATLPAWKDTVLVPRWGSVDLLVPVMDYSGMTMFHCHILEHEDIGMMGMWHIGGAMPM